MNFKSKVIILTLFFFSLQFFSNVNAQSTRDRQIAKYLYNFGLYLRFGENDYDIELIKIGVLNGSQSFLNELKRISANGYDNIILIEIINFKTVAEIKETHMLFLPKSKSAYFETVKRRIKGYTTALITEEYSPRKNVMINFVKRGSRYTFEMNPENLKGFNIGYTPNISQLGGTIINTKALFDESEKNLKEEKQKVRNQQTEINKQKKQIADQKASIEKQLGILLKLKKDIDAKKNEIENQHAELLKIEEESKKTKEERDKSLEDLKAKEDEIKEKVKVAEEKTLELQVINKELDEKQDRINAMNLEIAAQSATLIFYKNSILIVVGVSMIFLIMLFFIFRGYRIKKRNNKVLAKQKKEIEEKTHELEIINKELEKLSIVASETSNAVIILDTLGRFEWVNVGFTKMYGQTLDELKQNIGPDIYKASKRPDIEALMKTCLTKKTPVIYESVVTTSEDDEKWSQTTLTPIVNHSGEVTKLVLIDSDISKIKEAEDEIIRQNQKISHQAQVLEKQNVELEKLSLVASKTDNSVLIVDVDGEIEWVNDGFTRLLGLTFDEFKKEYGTNLFKTSLNPRLREQLQSAIKDRRSIIYSAKTATKAGRQIWIQTTMTPIYGKDGSLSKYIAIDADITKIKLAEEEITRQKQKITDSIIYAQKIQEAVLPPEEYLKRHFPKHFIMFKPKDIVSGDFYWATHKGNKVLIAAADCTGHGVPGGFMSMLGMTFLNEITGQMDENEITASKILNRLRNSVKNSLRQTGKEGETKDGMDIALCIFDKITNVIQFAGANNPLLIVREHENEIEIINVKADDMPIGIYYNEKDTFTNHSVQLKGGDLCYIFSDGFPDQFGGKYGRKFMAKRFKNMLAIHSDKPMEEQKRVIEDAFFRWKGKNRQIDDILVIGFKI